MYLNWDIFTLRNVIIYFPRRIQAHISTSSYNILKHILVIFESVWHLLQVVYQLKPMLNIKNGFNNFFALCNVSDDVISSREQHFFN